MGLSSSIQFRDKEAVLNAFDNRKVEAWSITQGKQFMFKGFGAEELKTIIDTLAESDSSALYTLHVYEDLEDAKEIKSNTPDDGSFNFKFNEDIRERYNNFRAAGNDNAILSKLNGIEERLMELEETETEPEKNDLGIIGKILEHPALAGVVPTLVEVLLNAIVGKIPQQPKVDYSFKQEQISHASNSRAVLNGIDEDKVIYECIDILKRHDKNLATHLQKLVTIAENDKTTFEIIINALN